MNQPGEPVLASDLDGTLIPLDGNAEQSRDLHELGRLLRERHIPLVYVSGRHLASIQQAREIHSLPEPETIICDVGSTICELTEAGRHEPLPAWQDHLKDIVQTHSRPWLLERCREFPELRIQEEVKQGPFKLSYYVDSHELPDLERRLREMLSTEGIAWSLICSVDPFNGDGLVDFLPRGISKAAALKWWADYRGIPHEQLLFAGDSGNDYAAFVAGFRAILVQNTDPEIVERVAAEQERLGLKDRFYHARQPASSGVLEGCRAYGIL